MFDELVLPEQATISAADGSQTTLRLPIRLPWYRSLPISCIEGIELTIDGEAVAKESLRVSVGDVYHSLEEAAQLHDVPWFVLDPASVEVQLGRDLQHGPHDVGIVLHLRVPYTEPIYWDIDFKQTAVCAKSVDFQGKDFQ